MLVDILTNYELCLYLPSTVAAAAICLMQNILQKQQSMTDTLYLPEIFTPIEQQEIEHCFFQMSVWLYWAQAPLPAPPPMSVVPRDIITAALCQQLAAISIPHRTNSL